MNYPELVLSGQCFGSSFYKLGNASFSLAYLAYPTSMMTLQAGIGYGAFIAADAWSNTTCHNILMSNNDAKFATAALALIGYSYSPPVLPEYLSNNVAGVLSYAFSNYSPLCYAAGSSALVNPMHVVSTCKASFGAIKNLIGSAHDAAKGFYHLGKGFCTTPEEVLKSHDDQDLSSIISLCTQELEQDHQKQDYSHSGRLSKVLTDYDDDAKDKSFIDKCFTDYDDYIKEQDKKSYDLYEEIDSSDWQDINDFQDMFQRKPLGQN